MAVLGAIAQFERERIAERVRAALAYARAQGKLGRPRLRVVPGAAGGLTVRQAAKLSVHGRTADGLKHEGGQELAGPTIAPPSRPSAILLDRLPCQSQNAQPSGEEWRYDDGL